MRKVFKNLTRASVRAGTRYAKGKIIAAASVAILSAITGGAALATAAADSAVQDLSANIASGVEDVQEILPTSTSAKAGATKAGASKTAAKSSASSSSLTAHKWSYKTAPNYYTVRGKAKTSKIAKGKVTYSKLDSLGRTRAVTAKVTYRMVADSAGWREDMPAEADTISGWGHNTRVSVSLSNGRTYNGYAFNRSHLLADSLGGHAIKRNLITGTRTQNVGNNDYYNPGGMAYTETLARDYLYSHKGGWVYYRATPVYKGSELVARSVYVDIKSDDGSINKRVEIYNAMRGYTINYKTGKITKSK